MRKYIFWILLLLLAGAVLSFISQSEQGYVLFRLGNTSVETTLWFVIIVLVLVVTALWFVIRLGFVIAGYPRKVGRAIASYDDKSKKKSVEKMLLAHFSGDYATSAKQAVKFGDKQLSPALGQIYRIEALMRQGRVGQALPALERALKGADPNTQPTLQALQMQLCLSQDRYQEVIEIFSGLPKDLRKRMRWQDTYWQALQQLGEIRQLVTSLPSPYDYSGRRQQRIFEYYHNAMASLSTSEAENAIADIRWLWQKLPARMQHQRFFAESYIKALLKAGDFKETEKQLRAFARIPALGALMQYWGDFEAPDLRRSLKELEKIYQNNQDQWTGLGLGLLCLQIKLWGKAENYMSTTLEQHTDPEVRTILLITLARLYHYQGDTDNATRCLSKLEPVHLPPPATQQYGHDTN